MAIIPSEIEQPYSQNCGNIIGNTFGEYDIDQAGGACCCNCMHAPTFVMVSMFLHRKLRFNLYITVLLIIFILPQFFDFSAT